MTPLDSAPVQNSDNYFNLQKLNSIKSIKNEGVALENAAKNFESIFIKMLLMP